MNKDNLETSIKKWEQIVIMAEDHTLFVTQLIGLCGYCKEFMAIVEYDNNIGCEPCPLYKKSICSVVDLANWDEGRKTTFWRLFREFHDGKSISWDIIVILSKEILKAVKESDE